MIERFLSYVTERQRIHERRAAGDPPPWTTDPVLASKKFCCVVRDDDRTSREAWTAITSIPTAEHRLGATLGFRMYNRVSTLEALDANNWQDIPAIMAGLDPAINATAYKISVKGGLFNLRTIASMVNTAWRRRLDFEPRRRAELTCAAVRGAVGCGPFIAYQTTQDLRWLYGSYEDEDTWCVVGLGACRGLSRLAGSYEPMRWDQKQARGNSEEELYARKLGFNIRAQERGDLSLPRRALELMAPILDAMRAALPHVRLNLFEVEHNLCEWDKWERITAGEGPGRSWRPKT
jgi:hypothetical protein